MKAIIFNSGLGSRMADLTKNNPKCMVKLYNGETIFERQLRILSECGIKEFIVTTGPFKEQLHEVANKFNNIKVTFVDNPLYKETNYIVSMNYAYDYLDDDFLFLHGDLVFNKGLVLKMLKSDEESLCLYNEIKNKPEKDFKGRIIDGLLKEVSVNIFDDNCYAFQPLYKLSLKDITLWKEKVREFVNEGKTNVYAENALNEITDKTNIRAFSYKDDYIDEIDNKDDYERVTNEIKVFDYDEQIVEVTDNYIKVLSKYLDKNDNILLVCGNTLKEKVINNLNSICNIIPFSAFTSNPKFSEIKAGSEIFKNNNCNKIVSIGGGSAIDVSKSIKLLQSISEEEFLNSEFRYNNIMHIAIPTTSGTGSESTQIAVVYNEGVKMSIDFGSILPDVAILDPNLLVSLPDYQKKCTMLDSLSQAIESFWSKGSTEKSKEYSIKCINLIFDNYKTYLNNEIDGLRNMLIASNFSGKAINISRTTAPHSMSYKLTSLYEIPHGHAVALGLIPCWKLLSELSNDNDELRNILIRLVKVFGKDSIEESIEVVSNFIKKLDLPRVEVKENDLEVLVKSVNMKRMVNNPIMFTEEQLYDLYKSIK